MNKRYLQYVLMIIFLQFLFITSTSQNIGIQSINQSYIIPFYNGQIINKTIDLTAQDYLLKAKFPITDNQIEGIYINGLKTPPQQTKKRGTIETDYFRIDKSKIRNGTNIFEIKFLKNYAGNVDFRIRNYQKVFLNAIFVFFDDSLVVNDNFNLVDNFKNFVIFGLLFYITFALFNITHRRIKPGNRFPAYLTSLLPFIIFCLSLRIFSLISNYNIFIKISLFWSLLIANLSLYYLIFVIKNIRIFTGSGILRNALSSFVIVFFSILIFFIIGEVTMRIVGRNSVKEQIFKLAGRDISYRLQPSFNGEFAGAAVTTNSWGFRGKKEYSPEKEPGLFRIFCLGDSIVFGYGVDDASTFPFLLEEMLNHTPGKRFEVINAAVTGYNAVQERLLLENVGLKFNPDFIVIGFCSNDITGGLRIPSIYGTLIEIADDPYRFADMGFLTKIEYCLVRKE